MVSKKTTSLIVSGVGLIISVTAIVLASWGFDEIVNEQIESELRLDIKGSEAYKNFEVTPIDIYMKFFIFNITNFDEAETAGKNWKPKVQEVGPYTYVEKRFKENISFINNKEQVEFLQIKTFHFDAARSGPNLSEDDMLIVINAPILGVLELLQSILPSTMWGTIASIMRDEPINPAFFTGTMKELMFTGAPSVFLTKLMVILETFGGILPEIPEFPANIKPLSTGETGFAFFPKNGSAEGPYTVHTGKAGLGNYQDIITFENKTHLGYWNDQPETTPENSCNRVRGTDGTVFKPFIKKTDRLNIFDTNTCRVLYMEYVQKIKHRGIEGYRFTLPEFQLANHTVNPDNVCYCYPDDSNCLGAGIINLVSCMRVPVYLSMPHFFQGADEYFLAVDGLMRDPEKHTTFIDVEPLTGFPLRAAKRIQMNFKVSSYDLPRFPAILKNLPDNLILPLLWVEEYGELDKKLADEFKSKISTPLEVMDVMQWVLLAFGVVVLLAGVGLFINARKVSAN
ncbi:unnamed protein product [Notodromas monacha]|uniref:Sensory neuron membrane protein 2 n=1 Tax=Notodromas monacha TaxID=399045 RepID=A0A7R9BUZ4_9CRUS|nr:unnamed protein product [Notodromas monacha]CAG0920708.1 unnamed protein product [Notodromas monacha]